jgi:hypothetical protein
MAASITTLQKNDMGWYGPFNKKKCTSLLRTLNRITDIIQRDLPRDDKNPCGVYSENRIDYFIIPPEKTLLPVSIDEIARQALEPPTTGQYQVTVEGTRVTVYPIKTTNHRHNPLNPFTHLPTVNPFVFINVGFIRGKICHIERPHQSNGQEVRVVGAPHSDPTHLVYVTPLNPLFILSGGIHIREKEFGKEVESTLNDILESTKLSTTNEINEIKRIIKPLLHQIFDFDVPIEEFDENRTKLTLNEKKFINYLFSKALTLFNAIQGKPDRFLSLTRGKRLLPKRISERSINMCIEEAIKGVLHYVSAEKHLGKNKRTKRARTK